MLLTATSVHLLLSFLTEWSLPLTMFSFKLMSWTSYRKCMDTSETDQLNGKRLLPVLGPVYMEWGTPV